MAAINADINDCPGSLSDGWVCPEHAANGFPPAGDAGNIRIPTNQM